MGGDGGGSGSGCGGGSINGTEGWDFLSGVELPGSGGKMYQLIAGVRVGVQVSRDRECKCEWLGDERPP